MYYSRKNSSVATAVSDFKFRNKYGTYRYRNLPCTGLSWAVCGSHVDENGDVVGGGVLEWCISSDDAHELKYLMGSDPQFCDLRVDFIPLN